MYKPGPTVGAYEGPVEEGEGKTGTVASAEIKCVLAEEAIKIIGAWRVVAGNVGGGRAGGDGGGGGSG